MLEKAETYCPKCEWRPASEDRWACVPSCATVWNTFWTRAVCPGCGVKWPSTQCLACHQFSPHEAWYHKRKPEDAKQERLATEDVDAA